MSKREILVVDNMGAMRTVNTKDLEPEALARKRKRFWQKQGKLGNLPSDLLVTEVLSLLEKVMRDHG